MTNVYLPLLTYLSFAKVINLRNYEGGRLFETPLFAKNDTVKNVLNEFRSTYHVITDEFINPSLLNIPIDLAIKSESEVIGSSALRFQNFDHVSLLLVTGYNTTVESVKEDAVPFSGWQKETSKKYTHYLSKNVRGGLFLTLLTVRPLLQGDAQIVRRIFKDVMGSSGSVGDKTADLWNKAIDELTKSEDMRGEISVGFGFTDKYGTNFSNPMQFNDIPGLIKGQKDVPNHVQPILLYQGFEPLHDLDEQYLTLEKNVLGERYLNRLYQVLNDLDYVSYVARDCWGWYDIMQNYPKENEQKCKQFRLKVEELLDAALKLKYRPLSIYEDIDKKAFDEVFEEYENGLDNTTESYSTAYKILKEKMTSTCGKDFLKPTRGYLKVNENEVIQNSGTEGGLEGCKSLCASNNRCRAVAYSENENKCLIYYRSTNTAQIILSPEEDSGFKIYDRNCKRKY